MNVVIILASGLGTRMKTRKNKVFLQIGKKPILFHTISCFENSSVVNKIIITSKEDEIENIKKIVQRAGFGKVTDIVAGGRERQESAMIGLEKAKSYCQKGNAILFHNGANPFVENREIEEVIEKAKKHGACAVAHPATDTIKEVMKGEIVRRTIERKNLRNMQTPQAIEFELAKEAFGKAFSECYLGTDDVSLVERLGKKVKIARASDNNFKITTQMNLEVARIIYKKLTKKND